MNSKKLHNLVFTLHRYLGLAVGLIIVIVGLTGSLLVFQDEINDFLVHPLLGEIIPQENRIAVDHVLDAVKVAYAAQPDVKLERVYLPNHPSDPYIVVLSFPTSSWTQIFVHPYTGAILKSRQWDNSFFDIVFRLHYALVADKIGMTIVGIVALLMCILTITGIVLWPGWRKLICGFKIKWDAHPKRRNFDIHKVTGIIAAVFLLITFFTGFCWNFSDFTTPMIYAITLTPIPKDPVSVVIADKSPLKLSEVLQKADAALPETTTVSIILPQKPEGVFTVSKRFPQEIEYWGRSQVYIDQYNGKVVRVSNRYKLPLGDAVLRSFAPLHYGTFGGLPTRIIYVFVGLAPLILFITGIVMWRYRYRAKPSRCDRAMELSQKL